MYYGVSSYNGSLMFEASLTGGSNGVGEVTWTSQAIDISDHSNINVSVDLFEDGELEGLSLVSIDHIIVEYKVQDISMATIASGEFTTNGNTVSNDFDYLQASLSGIRMNQNDPDSLLIITVTIHNTSRFTSITILITYL